MKIVGIIPARYGSTRFPGKPLADIQGKTMIKRVYEQATKSNLDDVVVATDDDRIKDEVKKFKGHCVLTANEHESGTERCQEAAQKLNLEPGDVVLNIQGDEPFIHPEQIDKLVDLFRKPNGKPLIGTLVKHIDDIGELSDPNTPKVVINQKGYALYFSRTPIPYVRGQEVLKWLEEHSFYKHIGIYAFSVDTLNTIVNLKPSNLEKAEALEQLRWLEHGYKIKTVITDKESISIDTPEDLNKIT